MKDTVQFSKIPGAKLANLHNLIHSLLPKQGAIEVQRDEARKEHTWHTHNTDETLIILEGSIQFYHELGEQICKPGDVIHLPKGTKHGSIALEHGAIYLISMEEKCLG